MTIDHRLSSGGFTLVILMAVMAVMAIALLAAERAWSSLMKQEREEELIFRGEQIQEAVWRYQQERGGALPTDLDHLFKDKKSDGGRYLRRPYADPMAGDGQWRFVSPADPFMTQPCAALPQEEGGEGESKGGKEKTEGPIPGLSGGSVSVKGPFLGVVSASGGRGFRAYNGRPNYSQWLFVIRYTTCEMEQQAQNLAGASSQQRGRGPVEDRHFQKLEALKKTLGIISVGQPPISNMRGAPPFLRPFLSPRRPGEIFSSEAPADG